MSEYNAGQAMLGFSGTLPSGTDPDRIREAEIEWKKADQEYIAETARRDELAKVAKPVLEANGIHDALEANDALVGTLLMAGKYYDARLVSDYLRGRKRAQGAAMRFFRAGDAAEKAGSKALTTREVVVDAPARIEPVQRPQKPVRAYRQQMSARHSPPGPGRPPKASASGKERPETAGEKRAQEHYAAMLANRGKPYVSTATTVHEYKVEPWEHKNPAPAGCRYQSRWIGRPLPPPEPWHATTPPWMDRPA